jgi:hypothetical protein
MKDVDRILAVKQSVAAKLHAIPGVHAVGVGAKVVGGKKTEELAIAVFVVKKKGLNELAESERVPSEIQGIKTDVVEMPRARLLTTDLSTLVLTLAPVPPGGGIAAIVSVTGKTIPDKGIVAVIDVIVQSKDGTSSNSFVSLEMDGKHTLLDAAKKLADKLSKDVTGVTATASAGPPAQITISPKLTFTVQVPRVFRVASDRTKYFPDYVRGGIQIQRGADEGHGTLGCLATTASTAQDPQGKVLALTNFHVVCSPPDRTTNLSVVVTGQTATFGTTDAQPTVTSGTLVALAVDDLPDPQNVLFSAFYTTAPNDTPAMVANRIAAAAAGAPAGINVAQTPVNSPNIVLTGPATIECAAYGTPIPDPLADLFATVTKPDATKNVIKFDGKVSSENYGIFVNISPGGGLFTFASFTNPQKDQSLDAIAAAVSAAINALPATLPSGGNLRGTVSAAPTGTSSVTVNSAEFVECRIVSDIQVGQPDNSFGSRCSRCCSHRIGRVLDAQIHSDVALIQLDPDLKYKMEIQEIGGGLKASSLPVVVGQSVQKRGKTSGKTTGAVNYVGVSADIPAHGAFFRMSEHGFMISSDTADPFSMPGDSGSAVISSADSSVVGILWGHQDTNGMAMELAPLLASFPALNLSFALKPGQDPNAVQTVPKPASAFQTIEDEGARGIAIPETPQFDFAGARLGQRLDEAESEIRQTVLGREFADAVRRHLQEAFALVNRNRRVATVWRRSGGPEILNALLRMIQFRNERLPSEINGEPLADCLSRIQQVVMRYASPDFSADLRRYTPQLGSFSRMTYPELLTAFQSASAD